MTQWHESHMLYDASHHGSAVWECELCGCLPGELFKASRPCANRERYEQRKAREQEAKELRDWEQRRDDYKYHRYLQVKYGSYDQQ